MVNKECANQDGITCGAKDATAGIQVFKKCLTGAIALLNYFLQELEIWEK